MYRGAGSYFEMSPAMYQPPPPATPGWELAPVPGWGANPDRSGPPRLAMNGSIPEGSVLPRWTPVSGCSSCNSASGLGADVEEEANEGYIALAGASGLFLGWFLCWAYNYSKAQKRTGR